MEDTFDLREFIVTILRKWRLIIILVILFALLGAGYQLMSALRAPSTALEEFNAQQELYLYTKDLLTAEIEIRTRDLANAQAFCEANPLMQMNEFSSYVGRLSYYVSVEQAESVDIGLLLANQIRQMYIYRLESGDFYAALARDDSYGATAMELQELVSAVAGDGNFFEIRVLATNQEDCLKLLEDVKRGIQTQNDIVENLGGPHNLIQVSETIGQEVNQKVGNAKIDIGEKIEKLQASIKSKEAELKALQPPGSTTGLSKQLSILKFALLGGAGGFGFALVCIFFLDMMNICVTAEDEINKKFGVPVLGRFLELQKKGKNNGQ